MYPSPTLLLTLVVISVTACQPAPSADAGNDAAPDASAVCPNGPAAEGEACATPASLRCPGVFASDCDGGYPRLHCQCMAGSWRCDNAVCDAGAPD